MSNDQWYYSTKDGSVHQGKASHAFDRMGPYPDEATARNALETARARTEAADEEDREWR